MKNSKSFWHVSPLTILYSAGVAFICMCSFYNLLLPNYTILGFMVQMLDTGVDLQSISLLSFLSITLILVLGYMVKTTILSVGIIGTVLLVLSNICFFVWLYSFGFFGPPSPTVVLTTIQVVLSLIIGFGVSFAKIDTKISGRFHTE